MLIGIDCATQDSRIGLARGSLVEDRVIVDEALVCGKERSATQHVAEWLADAGDRALLAIDAPLGWPAPLGASLVTHRAGDEISVAANQLFRRTTDRFIQERLGKTPLDVGADRIARTAHAALRMLGALRRELGRPIPLAWSSELEGIAAIEVYPAATLIGRRIGSNGYKQAAKLSQRREILERLAHELAVDEDRAIIEQNADALDAVLCVLAGGDFLRGLAAPPPDVAAVVSEGWIWTRLPGDASVLRGRS